MHAAAACVVFDESPYFRSRRVRSFEHFNDSPDLRGKGLFRRRGHLGAGFEGKNLRNWHHGFGPSSSLKCKLHALVSGFAENFDAHLWA